jgi:hypothetical protein
MTGELFISPVTSKETTMRTVTIPTQTVVESIQSYNYQVNTYVYVVIGVGKMIEGTFVFDVPQQFDSVYIIDVPQVVDPVSNEVITPAINDFTDLINQYPDGSFTTDNLWPYIDLIRSRR